MKTSEILEKRKGEILEKTMGLLLQALSGDPANRTFFFNVDKKNGELTVDYLYYVGTMSLGSNCFYTIRDFETPDPENFGYESLEEMDFYACGFDDDIENAIDEHIADLENMYL